MQELVEVTGLVLKSEAIGEYDKRVVLLTLERGKISCFARGARKPGNRFMAATNPFCFGDFKLFEGRSSYSLNEALISNYFEDMRADYEAALYGMYFLELMDYYTRENNDERELLKLLYQSLRALNNDNLPNSLIRRVFELKTLILEGEYPGVEAGSFMEPTYHALEHILNSPIQKLYTFKVSEEVLAQLASYSTYLMNKYTDRSFKSLEILDTL